MYLVSFAQICPEYKSIPTLTQEHTFLYSKDEAYDFVARDLLEKLGEGFDPRHLAFKDLKTENKYIRAFDLRHKGSPVWDIMSHSPENEDTESPEQLACLDLDVKVHRYMSDNYCNCQWKYITDKYTTGLANLLNVIELFKLNNPEDELEFNHRLYGDSDDISSVYYHDGRDYDAGPTVESMTWKIVPVPER